jgi:hypothetical protein
MKKLFILLALLCLLQNNYAQKVYATKSASIKFFSSTPMEDIEAINNQVESKLTDKGQIMFALLIKGFVFENELMQEHFNEPDWMDSNKYPKADFKGVITNFNKVNLTSNGNYQVVVTGNLTIRGITKKTTATGSINVKDGKISSNSVFKLAVTDFGITGKDIGKSIAKELQITVSSKYN